MVAFPPRLRKTERKPWTPAAASRRDARSHANSHRRQFEHRAEIDDLPRHHMPDAPVFLDEKMFKAVPKLFAAEFDLLRLHENSHLIINATVMRKPFGIMSIDEIGFLKVTENWILFSTTTKRI
ncbi:hypothetical protein ABID19_005775 [Mesorhizobium robiniae]|uniref:Uncharacterized protein n=1 Tax=Mesorhizobium robiniae TaxID=559315 RepID=A0ABV2GWN3_9HYPH|nr:DUF1173 family protein [Mesorhizobium sp. ZC-5]